MNYYITYFEIAAFIASLAAWGIIRGSTYLRLFPVLLVVIVGVEAYETFFRPAGQYNNAAIYNWQVPVQHLVYLAILYYSMEKRSHRQVLLVFLVGFALYTLLSRLLYTQKGRFDVLTYCIGSILLIVGIILKFYEMLQNPTDFNFLRKPFFYMLFAFLLFNVGTLPYFAMGNWLYFEMGYKNTVVILANVMSILNYVLYTTYTIAFIWIILRKGYS